MSMFREELSISSEVENNPQYQAGVEYYNKQQCIREGQSDFSTPEGKKFLQESFPKADTHLVGDITHH